MKPGGPVLDCPGHWSKARIVTVCANWTVFGFILGALFGYILRALE